MQARMRKSRTDTEKLPSRGLLGNVPNLSAMVNERKRRPCSSSQEKEGPKRRRLFARDNLYCEECGHNYKGDCPVHGPLIPLDETLGKDKKSLKYTSVFVPKQLAVRESFIPNAGLGVFAKELIPNRVQFGPFKGNTIATSDIKSGMDTTYMWEIKEGNKVTFIVDGKDLSTGNWMRYVNCARSKTEQNIVAFQYQENMFYRTNQPIEPGEELLVWYGDAYASELGINVTSAGAKRNDDEEVDLTRNGFTVAYKCLGCESAFVKHCSFQIHLKNNKGCDMVNPRTFTCQKCGVTFGRLFQLQFHIHQHLATEPEEQGKDSIKSPTGDLSGDNLYKCVYCDYCCSRSSNLRRHLRTHTGDKPYRCTYCNYRCSQSGHLKRHLRTHTGDKPYKCTYCGYCCSQSGDLKVHLRTHTGEKPYKCTYCDYRCSHSGTLKTHLRTHNGDKPYKCTYCDYCCNHSGHLKRHLRIHTGTKPYKCSYCGYCCSQSRDLKAHLRTHTGDKPYKCTYCDYRCSQSGHLTRHIRTHTGDKPFKCTHCGYSCSQSGDLKVHLRTHTGDKPYNCAHCDYSCSHSGTLKTHLRTHIGDKPYKCTYCDYCCNHSGHLNRHLRTHTGDKPYKCTHCGYSCSQSGHLRRHLRTHTSNKLYKCTYCDYCSSWSSNLQRHLRTHTGDKPYKCTYCDYCCSYSGVLKRHLKTHNL